MYQPIIMKKKFIIEVGDLTFCIYPNNISITKVINGIPISLKSSIIKTDLDMLKSFVENAYTVISPFNEYHVVFEKNTGNQDVFLLKDSLDDYALVINNQVQFTTNCERYYHEGLVSPAIGALEKTPDSILILGGGDGLAAKQIFKEHPDTKVTLVDYDKDLTDLFRLNDNLRALNENSLSKCEVINEDAFLYVGKETRKFDIIICDFPDPDQEIFNKLYSLEFYELLEDLLNENGVVCVQSGPLAYNSKCFLCITKTLETAGYNTLNYYTTTPFGPSNFVLAKRKEVPVVNLRNTYETLNQEFFKNAMCAAIPNFIKNYESVSINTVDNYAAYTYKLIEHKLLKEEDI